MIAGLDIGFGDVKVVTDDGRKMKFPTAVTKAEEGIGDFAGNEEEYLFDGKKYILGDKALFRSYSTCNFEFLKKYSPLLAFKAVREMNGAGEDVPRIGVGLPINYFTEINKQLVTQALSKVMINGQFVEFLPTIFPQGVGVLLDYRLDDDGNEIPGTAVDGMVIDIGFNTVDVVAFAKGTAIKADSNMLEREGISKIAQNLAKTIQRETTINLSEQEAKKVLLEGKMEIYATEKDFSQQIRDITDEYVEGLINHIQSKWEDRIQRSKVLIFAGGGAYLVRGSVPERYRKLIRVPEDAEYANARGFLKALKVHAHAATR